jgi:hypothetical protein
MFFQLAANPFQFMQLYVDLKIAPVDPQGSMNTL